MRDTPNTKLLAGGAVGAAIAASVCCIGPLLLALLGLGGGALLLKLEPYRPYFLAATGLILAGAFSVTYRRAPAEQCEPGTAVGQSGQPNRSKDRSLDRHGYRPTPGDFPLLLEIPALIHRKEEELP